MAELSKRIPRLRHLRHRMVGGFGKLRRVSTWFGQQATDLNGTGTPQVYSIADVGANTVTITGHGYTTGQGPFMFDSDTTIPGGLTNSTFYYVRVVDANTVTLHLTEKDAVNNTNTVDITSSGAGTLGMGPFDTADALLDHVRRGNVTPDRLSGLTDIDSLF